MSGGAAVKINKKLRGDQKAIAEAVKVGKEAAQKEGKTKVTDKHTAAVTGVRPILTIVKDVIAKLEAKSEKGKLDRNETFALALFTKLKEKASDNVIMTLIRNGTK